MNTLDRSAGLGVLLATCGTVLLPAAQAAEPLTVFDLTLNAPFAIRECAFEVIQQDMGIEGVASPKRNRGLFGKPASVERRYRYTEPKPAEGKCFQRVGPFYTSAPDPGLPLPPPTPPDNMKVKLVYADALRPALADSEDIWVGIQDSKLTGVRFYFQRRNERDVLQALTRKYGAPASTEKFILETPEGVRKDYVGAKWSFPTLQVSFLGLDTRQIGYDPQDAPIGYFSEVGSVTVQYAAPQPAAADRNPL